MRPKVIWALLTISGAGTIYLLPATSLSFVKHLLEVMVVIHLCREVLQKMQE